MLFTDPLATMALGGLWHGANLTFLAWGVFHGALLVSERATSCHRSNPLMPTESRRTCHSQPAPAAP